VTQEAPARDRSNIVVRAIRRILASPSSAVLSSTVGINLIRIVSSVCLTHILVPDIFGQTAIVSSVFFLIAMITDLGFEAYVVRHARGDEQAFLDATWTLHAIRGVMNFFIAGLLAFPAAYLLGKPQVGPVLFASSLTLAIDGMVSFGIFIAVRNKQFGRLSMFELFVSAFQTAMAILMALLTHSIWGFVIATIAGSIMRTCSSYAVFRQPYHKPRFDRALARDMWIFSRPIFMSSIITLILAQTDKMILARAFTLAEFGVYGIAANIATAPQAFGYGYTNKVVYARLTGIERNESGGAVRAYYDHAWAFSLYLWGVGLLIGCASVVIRIMYDPRYYGAAQFLSILAIASGMMIMCHTAANLFVVLGRAVEVLRMNIARLIWLVLVAPVAFIAFRATGLIVALGLIELPPYLFSLYRLSQINALSLRKEAIAWLTGLFGLGCGLVVALAANRLFPHL
jgi:lipopolysaccharide exporter